MGFQLKLNWENFFQPDEPVFSPVASEERLRDETGVGASSRSEYLEQTGRVYLQDVICSQMWTRPQIDWDGKVLGCRVNYWKDYGNAFENDLLEELNNEKISYARQMLTGEKVERADIACTTCAHYKFMKSTGQWLKSP